MNIPTFIRRCDKCQKDLAIEPAIKGLQGKILCFFCRYKLDEAGGERYLHDTKLYPEREAAWQAEFGRRWKLRSKIVVGLELLSGVSGVGVIITIFYIGSHLSEDIWRVGLLPPISLFLALCGSFGGSTLAKRFQDPPRPTKPIRDESALHSTPELLFDGNSEADLGIKFLHYKPQNLRDSRDPPDWESRRKKCLERDGYRCRLCNDTNDLDVHHVIPRRYGGSHSLQNLITLCVKCHGEQKYFRHDSLISRNRKEWRNRLAKHFLKRTRQKSRLQTNNQLPLNLG